MQKEVAVSEIHSNPYRNTTRYPLDDAKIAKLRSSIKRTGFWENIVARPVNGHYEIAYGHHRLEALRREKGKSAKVYVIVKKLSDEAMLKMMAADNDDAYNLSPGFILETVEAALRFNKAGRNVTPEKTKVHIAAFLSWPTERVSQALAQLSAIKDGSLSKEAVESLPTIHHATILHREVKRAKDSGKAIPKAKQVKIAKEAARAEDESPKRIILERVRQETLPERVKKSKAETQRAEFEGLLNKVVPKGYAFERGLDEVLEQRALLHSDVYKGALEVYALASVCNSIQQKTVAIFKGEQS